MRDFSVAKIHWDYSLYQGSISVTDRRGKKCHEDCGSNFMCGRYWDKWS